MRENWHSQFGILIPRSSANDSCAANAARAPMSVYSQTYGLTVVRQRLMANVDGRVRPGGRRQRTCTARGEHRWEELGNRCSIP